VNIVDLRASSDMYIDPQSRTEAFVPSVVNAGSCFAISSAADFERGMNFFV
jgi:hypothetical protein